MTLINLRRKPFTIEGNQSRDANGQELVGRALGPGRVLLADLSPSSCSATFLV